MHRTLPEFLAAARELRSYIAAHPGLTCKELYEAVPQANGMISYLTRRGLVRFNGNWLTGGARYYAVPMKPVQERDVEADLSYENT